MTRQGDGAPAKAWPRRPRLGLRARVVVWYVVLFAALLGVGIVTLERLLIDRLSNAVVEGLTVEVDELRLLSRDIDPRTEEPFGDDPRRLLEVFIGRNVPAPGEAFFALVDGRPYASSANVPEDLFARADLLSAWSSLPDEGVFGLSETDAGPVRWLAVPVRSETGPEGTFVVAQFYGADRAEISDAVRVLGLVSLGILALATLLAWLTAGRVIAPIRRLDRAARRASATDLTERLPVRGDDEVARLTETFNALLARLEAAFAAQRAFLDDVGHDLRTPITILRGNLELLPDDPAERAEVLELCLDELSRMERYVSDLTLITRAERPDFLRLRPTDTARLTQRVLESGRGLDPDRRWELDAAVEQNAMLDEDLVLRAWLNLVGNAVQHTEPGDRIRIGSSVEEAGDQRRLVLHVQDSGPGVAIEDRERIFDRNERLGLTREQRPEGSGLGLAIARAVAEAHGGTARVENARVENARVDDRGNEEARGARFVLDLPLREPDPGPGGHPSEAVPALERAGGVRP